MGGQIGIKSKPSVGTTVTFTVSFQKVPKDFGVLSPPTKGKELDPMSSLNTAGHNGQSPAHLDLSKIPRDQLRICIAEDNPINQKIAISFVQKLGFEVDAYDNGRQAVDALQAKAEEEKPYHLVLMDVQMPELDGYEATRLIRKDKLQAVREVLVIAMTASAIRGDREKCIDAGMNNYLAKPVRANVLKGMLEQYLQQPSQQIPNLQQEANNLAASVIKNVDNVNSVKAAAAATATKPQPPKLGRQNTTISKLDHVNIPTLISHDAATTSELAEISPKTVIPDPSGSLDEQLSSPRPLSFSSTSSSSSPPSPPPSAAAEARRRDSIPGQSRARVSPSTMVDGEKPSSTSTPVSSSQSSSGAQSSPVSRTTRSPPLMDVATQFSRFDMDKSPSSSDTENTTPTNAKNARPSSKRQYG
ncbi:MAG: hypothetical protein M1837_003772 [Sclerophora amabilis]|nr:MAG: hypothetical protein M1837_003772 [Sclerophora amabilis]